MSVIKESQITVNWLLNSILGTKGQQITKVDDDQLFKFIQFLSENPLTMPNGQNALQWIRERLALRYDQAQNKMSQEWEKTRQRYRFIIQQLDLVLIKKPIEMVKPKESSNELQVTIKSEDNTTNQLNVSF